MPQRHPQVGFTVSSPCWGRAVHHAPSDIVIGGLGSVMTTFFPVRGSRMTMVINRLKPQDRSPPKECDRSG
jgi:hypothetical protein